MSRDTSPRVYGWLHPAVVAAAVFSAYAGFSQFAATAALPDIAAGFGERTPGAQASLAQQVGLSGTTLGLGLGVIRLASIAALPMSRLADRHGRRRVMLFTTSLALLLTALAAGAPSFWLFVTILAVSRPLMSATNGVAGVIAAEEVRSRDRSKAIALITVGYGIGAGIPIILRGIAGFLGTEISFRTLFLLAAPLLLTVPLIGRVVREPDRATAVTRAPAAVVQRLGRVPHALRGRLLLLSTLTFFVGYLTGPVNTYLFVYAESVAGVAASTLLVVAPAAAAAGAAGLWVGVHLADRFGRIPTAMLTKFALAAVSILTYSAGAWGAVAGYVASLFIASSYAPAVGATTAEIFPTSMRATATGWLTLSSTIGAVLGLLVFGWVSELADSFAVAAVVVSVPVAISMVGYRFLPETKGKELEESAPEVQ
ncbi:MAG TPA: MFS transporter [Euzebya sp.]|nr:MFS transporter [Euzebya sp.]